MPVKKPHSKKELQEPVKFRIVNKDYTLPDQEEILNLNKADILLLYHALSRYKPTAEENEKGQYDLLLEELEIVLYMWGLVTAGIE